MAQLHAILCVIREWQDFIAGLIGAAALIVTVWWTLTREQRRQRSEEMAFRIALGTEVRQLAAAALNCYEKISNVLQVYARSGQSVGRAWLAAHSQLPEPVVYPRNADKVGSLGPEAAFNSVFFYGQLALLADSVRRTALTGDDATKALTTDQVVNVMTALVTAAAAAVEVLPKLQSPAWTEQDATFKGRVEKAVEELKKRQEDR